MEFEKDNSGSYVFPHERDDLTVHVRPTANAWWQDPFKVYLLLQAFDNHCAPIEEACHVAGITRRQYKYFAQEHPVMYERRRAAKFIKREKEVRQKHLEVAQRVLDGDAHAAAQYLAYEDPMGYDGRYRSDYARLRRLHGLPAIPPRPRTEKQKLRDMEIEVEKTRIMLGHPSNRKHYAVCDECRHLLGNVENKKKEEEADPIFFF